MAEINAETIATTQELAAIFGVTDRRVQQLQKEGVISQVGRNEYNLSETIQRYIRSFQVVSSNKKYQDERTKLTQANREIAEIELQLLKGDVHRSDDVRDILHEMLSNFRSRLLVMPARAAVEISAVSDVGEIQQILKREVSDALTELSEYDPAKLQKMSKDRVVDVAVKSSAKKKTKSK